VATAPLPDLALGEWVTLALLREKPTHGWGIVKLLARDGEVGTVWSLSRPLVYRAIDRLEAAKLAVPRGVEKGSAPSRKLVAATPTGARLVDRWLATPVDHVRDVRTELLVKLVLRQRRGLDLGPLVRSQQRRLAPVLTRLERAHTTDVVAMWRAESASSVRRFLASVAEVGMNGQPGS
jgi:PadR family transcriptional regulator AphA